MNPESAALSPQTAWEEMVVHLSWSDGFCLCFLFSDHAASLLNMRQWAADFWQSRSAPLHLLAPQASADALAQIEQGLRLPSQAQAPIWVEMMRLDTSQDAGWEQARAQLLARLNESRQWLIQELARPLVICLPAAWRKQVVQLAPDLWQVRSFTAWVAGTEASKLMPPEFPTPPLPNQAYAEIAPARAQYEAKRQDWLAADEGKRLAYAREWMWSAWKLGDAYLDQSQLPQALTYFREALALAREARRVLGESLPVLNDLAAMLLVIGDAESSVGRTEPALAAYQESLELLRDLRTQQSDDCTAIRGLLVALHRLGEAEKMAGRCEAALQNFREALQLARQIHARVGDQAEVLRDMYASLHSIGDTEMALGRVEAAVQAQQEALALVRQVLALFDDREQTLHDLCISLRKLGMAEQAAGRLAAASEAYLQGLAFAKQIHARLGDQPLTLRNLLISFSGLGGLAYQQQDLSQARQYWQEAEHYALQLQTMLGDTPQVQSDLQTIRRNLAQLPNDTNDTSGTNDTNEHSIA